jgi:hypothetical protein
VIERKYLEMFDRLKKELPPKELPPKGGSRGMEPLPGWFARHRRDLRPSREVLATIPQGPALDKRRSA